MSSSASVSRSDALRKQLDTVIKNGGKSVSAPLASRRTPSAASPPSPPPAAAPVEAAAAPQLIAPRVSDAVKPTAAQLETIASIIPSPEVAVKSAPETKPKAAETSSKSDASGASSASQVADGSSAGASGDDKTQKAVQKRSPASSPSKRPKEKGKFAKWLSTRSGKRTALIASILVIALLAGIYYYFRVQHKKKLNRGASNNNNNSNNNGNKKKKKPTGIRSFFARFLSGREDQTSHESPASSSPPPASASTQVQAKKGEQAPPANTRTYARVPPVADEAKPVGRVIPQHLKHAEPELTPSTAAPLSDAPPSSASSSSSSAVEDESDSDESVFLKRDGKLSTLIQSVRSDTPGQSARDDDDDVSDESLNALDSIDM